MCMCIYIYIYIYIYIIVMYYTGFLISEEEPAPRAPDPARRQLLVLGVDLYTIVL